MIDGIQDFFVNAGDSGCYAFAIIHIAEKYLNKELDVVKCLIEGCKKGFIYYNFQDKDDTDNFYIKRPDLFLGMLINKKVSVRKENAGYETAIGEYAVNRWERKVTSKIISHFACEDYDSLLDSQTVKYGVIASKRVFTIQ